NVNEQFQISRQFWSYLVDQHLINDPRDFIRPLPHISLVEGKDNIAFLKKRFEALSKNHLFTGMEFSEDPAVLSKWFPLIMEGRKTDEPLAATKIDGGTDVNFGSLTRLLFEHLQNKQVTVHYQHKIQDIKRTND